MLTVLYTGLSHLGDIFLSSGISTTHWGGFCVWRKKPPPEWQMADQGQWGERGEKAKGPSHSHKSVRGSEVGEASAPA